MTFEDRPLTADTHTLIWHLTQDGRLSNTARDLMDGVDRGESALVISTIVLAEALWISERRSPGVTFDQVVDYILAMPKGTIAPLDIRVLQEAQRLPQGLELHDRLIAATARAYNAALITRDRQLKGAVETFW